MRQSNKQEKMTSTYGGQKQATALERAQILYLADKYFKVNTTSFKN